MFLTRSADTDIPLDMRTTFANNFRSADIFVSIHANNGNDQAQGIETFCLTPQLFKKYGAYAHVSNATDPLANKYNDSKKLAHSLHTSVVDSAKKKHNVVDRHIKHSVAQVLLGSNMPAALIELGFLSNKREAFLLNDASYRTMLAQGICAGISDYFKHAV